MRFFLDLFIVSKYKKQNNSENALSPLQMVLQNLKGNFVNFVKLILFCKRCTNLRQCLTETVALLPFPYQKRGANWKGKSVRTPMVTLYCLEWLWQVLLQELGWFHDGTSWRSWELPKKGNQNEEIIWINTMSFFTICIFRKYIIWKFIC